MQDFDRNLIKATVVDISLSEGGGLGEYEFLQIPSPGDRICLPSQAVGLQIWRTIYSEYSPRWISRSKAAAIKNSTVTIFAELIEDVID